jgi:hypothetical protein
MKKIFRNQFFIIGSLIITFFIFLQITSAQDSLTNTTTISPNIGTSIEIVKVESKSTANILIPATSTITPTITTQENTLVSPTQPATTIQNSTNTVNIAPSIQEQAKIQTIEPIKSTDATNINNGALDSSLNETRKVETVDTQAVPITTKIQETKIQNTSDTFEAVQTTIQNTKEELKKIVEQNIDEIISRKTARDTANIESKRAEIINNINNAFTNTKPITQEKINELSNNIQSDLNKINNTGTANAEPSNYSKTIEQTFNTMSLNIEDQVRVLKDQGGDMLYKDTNNDGISDYDSIHVYNIDPIKPTPTTAFEGKIITAGEKVLLGFDPTKADLIKVIPEEPMVSEIKPTEGYKVQEVKLAPDNKVTISGRFLPNTYVTLYIYSTPIIVTVKTDVNGEWKYTLDKELDNGKHTIYTATVNNTGKILAKSPAFGFIKTAEAATLENLPPIQIPATDIRPGILSSNNIYIIIGSLVLVLLLAIILIGKSSNKKSEPLLDYINLQTQRGFSKEVITSELLNNGWTIQDIDEGFKIVTTSK